VNIGHFADQAKDGIGIAMECVIARFIFEVNENEETTRHPQRQSGYAYQGINLLFSDCPQGCFEIASDHSLSYFEEPEK
jgi:hypothetical protein